MSGKFRPSNEIKLQGASANAVFRILAEIASMEASAIGAFFVAQINLTAQTQNSMLHEMGSSTAKLSLGLSIAAMRSTLICCPQIRLP
jgi:hypothetical protein